MTENIAHPIAVTLVNWMHQKGIPNFEYQNRKAQVQALNAELGVPSVAAGITAGHGARYQNLMGAWDQGQMEDLAVDLFAAAMKQKLAKKRTQGFSGGLDPAQCTTRFLSLLLVEHIDKGDPVDIGALAMMLFHRGETVSGERARYLAKIERQRGPYQTWEQSRPREAAEKILRGEDTNDDLSELRKKLKREETDEERLVKR